MDETAVGPPRFAAPREFDVDAIRDDFPALDQEIGPGVPLVYLDSAATALKPWAVIRAVEAYNADYPANVHRGLHTLSEKATEAYEGAREQVAAFLGGVDSSEVVFTSGTTASINLVALSWGRTHLGPGDEIVLSVLEHHSNLVPWQLLAQAVGATLAYVDLTPEGLLDLGSLDRALARGRARLVAITAMSNVLGTRPPVAEIARRAHAAGALVVVDAAQGLPHQGPGKVSELGADFLAFSGHKLFGPTGVGVLWARRELLEAMPPVFGGGSMVTRVGACESEWNDVPWKFEAGTPPIAGAIGLGAAVDYLSGLDWAAARRHERALTARAHDALGSLEGVRVHGPAPEQKGGIVGFTVEGVHPHDLAQLVDRRGVAIRAGHHCAMPLHQHLDLSATARASFAVYNTLEEIDLLAEAIVEAQRRFRVHRIS